MKGLKTFLAVHAFLAIGLSSVWLAAQGQSREHVPSFAQAVRHDVSPPLRTIPRTVPAPRPDRQIPNLVKFRPPGRGGPAAGGDPLLDTGAFSATAATPVPLISFEGLSDDDNQSVIGGRVVPPDTQGDVSPDHYIQMVNLIFAVYDKETGNFVPGGEPRPNSDLWNGFGGVCEVTNDGDPIVLWDHLAQRWVISQFGLGQNSPVPGEADGHQCIAVSKTSDPLGEYYRYDFVVSESQDGGFLFFAINDYPKIGLWPDAYYLTFNEFQCNSLTGQCDFTGANAVAFERDAMLLGLPAQQVKFGPLPCSTECFFSLQPSHLEGPAPAAGTPNTFVMAFDDETWGSGGGPDGYRLWDFSPNWANPNASTFTSLGQVDTAEFDANLCDFAECVPQSGGELLDTLSQFTMYRAPQRDFGTHRSIVLNHTVDVGSDRAGIRWTELRNAGSGWVAYQSGTFAPDDGLQRWMGSIAMDSEGNIALGYSVSSSSSFPEIRYTSREANDPPGTLPGGEVLMQAGGGAQVDSFNRWGDYSTMSVDPDGCRFWYTQEYYGNTANFDFKTRIASFQMGGCGQPAVCGDGVREGTEECDGTDFGGATCSDFGCQSGSLACLADCTIDSSGCTDCGVQCDDDGVCEGGEICDTCPNDCPSGPIPTCGDGTCDPLAGEDCTSCAQDCNGKLTGRPSDRFCCGDPATGCGDPRCNSGGFVCQDGSSTPGEFCCGDGLCDPGESCGTCALDCGQGPEICDDGVDNDCNGATDCEDSVCVDDPACTDACVPTHDKEKGKRCGDGIDNDCDGLVDAADPDCQ